MEKLITIFTTPKPFKDQHLAMIQQNAIRSWLELGDEVEVVLIGDDQGVAQTAKKLHVKHISQVVRNKEGTPLLSSIFSSAHGMNASPLLAYINADVIVLQEFLSVAKAISKQSDKFLLVGQRWDLEINHDMDFKEGWQDILMIDIKTRGGFHPPAGSDYFIFPRVLFPDIPPFALGRAGWDNWMIFKARWEHWKVIDCTGTISVVHQDHDYSHLPGGRPHYRLPETHENVRLAGGKRTIFHLEDADMIWKDNKMRPPKLTWKKCKREIETFPLNYLHSFILGQVAFAFWHPRKAFQEIKTSLRKNRKMR